MIWWKYKPLFEIKWREPYGFTHIVNKLEEKSSHWWFRPLLSVFISAVFFVIWNSNKSDEISTGLVAFISLAFGFGSIYFIALVQYLGIRKIGLGEKALVILTGLNTQGWPYNKMSKVEFRKETFREKEFDIMVVTMVNSCKLILAVPRKVDLYQVIGFLKSKGVESTKLF